MKEWVASLILNGIYYPLTAVLKNGAFFLPSLKARILFEKKNHSLHGKGTRSFKLEGRVADLCFEFSSEGEFQQVASLIEDALKEEKLVELVFFSPSVERTVIELFHKFPNQIRYLRFPLVEGHVLKWMTSQKLVLVRYDLFLEFFVWSLNKKHQLIFIWVTLKKERLKGKAPSFIKKAFLAQSHPVIFASKADQEFAQTLKIKGGVYDFRMEQIKRRLCLREDKLAPLVWYQEFKQVISRFPLHKRVILGNAWPVDMTLLAQVPGDFFLLIVPHQLSPTIFDEMSDELKKMGRPVQVVDARGGITGTTVILNLKGVLCELYADFFYSYVGGGLGESVHSILEPLVASHGPISCGPNHLRSTEYDVALDLGRIHEVNSSKAFIDFLTTSSLVDELLLEKSHEKQKIFLESQFDSYATFRKDIFPC